MLANTTKQKFEYFLETHCNGSIFHVLKTSDGVLYFWKKHDEVIATQTIEYGNVRRFYEVKI